MKFSNIESILRQNKENKLYLFSSSCHVLVARIDNTSPSYYNEHPHLNDLLVGLDKKIKKPKKKQDCYIFGDPNSPTNLDRFLKRGHNMSFTYDEEFIASARGYDNGDIPEVIHGLVKDSTTSMPVRWVWVDRPQDIMTTSPCLFCNDAVGSLTSRGKGKSLWHSEEVTKVFKAESLEKLLELMKYIIIETFDKEREYKILNA